MQQYIFTIILGVVAALASTSASVISCPPNDLQEASPNLRQLCYAIEQAISENSISGIPQEQYKRFQERTVNENTKRQDVDHVFLRFGRHFGV